MRNRLLAFLVSAALLASGGCAKKNALAPDPASSQLGAARSSGLELARPIRTTGAAEIHGTIGPGTLYALFRPEEWNGDLVLYIHGYIVPEAPIALPTLDNTEALRDELLARHYAVGYSSFSQNGFVVKDAAQWTDQLRAIFATKLGTPRRTYLIAHSLGGLSAIMLIEQHPDVYAGALPIAGALGGSRAEIDYHANVRILFELFYPHVLRGSLLDQPPDLEIYRDIVVPCSTAMALDPTGAGIISRIDQTPVPYSPSDLSEIGQSIIRSLAFHAVALNDLLERTHGHSFFDNSQTVYTGALPPEVLAYVNASVQRYTIASDAKAFLEKYYEPTGNIGIPVLTLHTTRDPIVPIFHETMYHDRVAAAGRLEFLLQRKEDRYDHGGFSASEMAGHFEDLVDWVESGVKPAARAQ